VRQDSGGAELELLPVADPAAILSAVIAHGGAITRFQIVEPSLEAIFIEHVGRSADDDEARASEAMMPSITMEGIA
jgi:ABC-type uncharacterized transport system ATPase subunit